MTFGNDTTKSTEEKVAFSCSLPLSWDLLCPLKVDAGIDGEYCASAKECSRGRKDDFLLKKSMIDRR